MKLYYIIDADGYFIEPVFLDISKYIEVEPIGFKKPKWNGTEWIEG